MLYFDTDVIIHYIIFQNERKQKFARKIIKQAIEKNIFCISTLTLQELAFVLSKLQLNKISINKNLEFFLQFDILTYKKTDIKRGFQIAQKVGFKNINDCIHTAIAEINCTELITFNKKDFFKIQKYSELEIKIIT